MEYLKSPEAAAAAAGSSGNLGKAKVFCDLHVICDINAQTTYLLECREHHTHPAWCPPVWRVLVCIDRFHEFRWARKSAAGVLYETGPAAGAGYHDVSFLPVSAEAPIGVDHWDYSDGDEDDGGFDARWTGFDNPEKGLR